jgi:hypothetical protein
MLRARFRSREVGYREPTTHFHRYRRALLRWQREHVPALQRLASNRTVVSQDLSQQMPWRLLGRMDDAELAAVDEYLTHLPGS